jgi:hypothetical protein
MEIRNPSPTAKRIDWTAAPIVFVTLPTCPTCGGTKYCTRRSAANGDGTRTKLATCATRGCGQAFKIVGEFPEFGSVDSAFGLMPSVQPAP